MQLCTKLNPWLVLISTLQLSQRCLLGIVGLTAALFVMDEQIPAQLAPLAAACSVLSLWSEYRENLDIKEDESNARLKGIGLYSATIRTSNCVFRFNLLMWWGRMGERLEGVLLCGNMVYCVCRGTCDTWTCSVYMRLIGSTFLDRLYLCSIVSSFF
jgi:hypothetical protein